MRPNFECRGFRRPAVAVGFRISGCVTVTAELMQILHCVQMTIQSRYDCTRVLRSVKHPANCDVRQRLVALLGKNVQTSRGDKSPSYTEPTISMSVCRIEPPASV